MKQSRVKPYFLCYNKIDLIIFKWGDGMINVKEITIEFFCNNIYDKYTTLFNEKERRSWEGITKLYNDGLEKFYAVYLDNEIVGFFFLERLNDYPYYLDYFAIYKEYQSMGLGSKVIKYILDNIVKEDGLIGEIEELDNNDPNTIRRWNFYNKSGFKKYDEILFNFNDVVFELILYPSNSILTCEEVANILCDYYKVNVGLEEVKNKVKVIERGK